jgi:hypothetical protein
LVRIELTDSDWAAAGTSTLNGLFIPGITPDADAVHTAINLGDGWDYAITIPDGGVADNSLSLGDDNDAEIYFNGTDLWIDVDDTAGGTTGLNLRIDRDEQIILDDGGGFSDIIFDARNALNTGYNTLEIQVTAVQATNGSDIINMLHLDWNETDWATATEEWNAINIDDITQDAQGTYYGVHVGTGVDGAFYHEGVAHASLGAPANGSIVFCTDCDPASTPCTSAGAQTGAFAFRVAGAWDCPW